MDVAQRTKECDLVMKGGITSGVVYPAAVEALAGTYRFCNIGGASAGAIAAAITAAAEYGYRAEPDSDTQGFARLQEVNQELATKDFLLSLFQPARGGKPLFDGAIALMKHRQGKEVPGPRGGNAPPSKKVPRVWSTIWRLLCFVWLHQLVVSLIALAVLAVAVVSVVRTADHGWGIVAVVLSVVLALATAAMVTVGEAARILLGAYRAINKNNYGICLGMRVPGSTTPGFTEWLDQKIQDCAGLDREGSPLTFRDLHSPPDGSSPINLNLVTTDLSLSRPVILPLREQPAHGRYLFKKKDMVGLFPARVVEFMWSKGEYPGAALSGVANPKDYCYFPAEDLPVVVAFRMSLSFPVLISGVPLYSYDKDAKNVVTHWFSDGGISSNFPIHFFDSLIPGRPTFGLDLQPYPKDKLWDTARRPDGVRDVYMPRSPKEPRRPRWVSVRSLVGFLAQIIDAFENWRDNMQSELPGFRDRICEIYLSSGEGGLNLAMPPDVIAGLTRKGRDAGNEILGVFDPQHWNEHRFTRYLTTMQMLQMRLQQAGQPFPDFSTFLRDGAPGIHAYRNCHEPEWCRAADAATSKLLAMAGGWGTAGAVDFWMDQHCDEEQAPLAAQGHAPCDCEPKPTATLRVVPNV